MPALEFTYQDTPWICNGWDTLAPQFQLADAEALLDWIEAFSANTPLWTFLRAHFGIGPLIEIAGQGCKDLRASAKAAGFKIAAAEKELAGLTSHWQKEQALQKKRDEDRAAALGQANNEEIISVGALKDLPKEQVATLLHDNGFDQLPQAMRLKVANRILELAPQLNSPATRQQAHNLIEMEVTLENYSHLMQVLAEHQASIIENEDELSSNLKVEKLLSIQKAIANQEKASTALSKQHASLLEAIGADQVTMAVQKSHAIDQIGYCVSALIDYYGKQDNHLVDGVFTERELKWLLTSTPYRPILYRLPLTVRINEALQPDALWNPDWEPSPITREAQRTLAKIVQEFGTIEEPEHFAGVDDLKENADDDPDDDIEAGGDESDLGDDTEESTPEQAAPNIPSTSPNRSFRIGDDESCI